MTFVSVTRHRPAVQSALQDSPHPPQLFESVCSFTHERPHAVSPLGHTQTPPWQVAIDGQILPHEPQLFGSACSSEHAPPLVAAPLARDPLSTPDLAVPTDSVSRPPHAEATITASPSGNEQATLARTVQFVVQDGIARQG
jgi:hypothetical protein